jgi:hypothetical protein
MDAQKFGRAFPPLPEKTPPSNPERRELLAAPRKWMRFFDDTLNSYLSGEPLMEPNEFIDTINEYMEWGAYQLSATSKKLTSLHDENSAGHVESELGFHKLNSVVVPVWGQLLYGWRLDPDELSELQIQLAIENAPLIQKQRMIAHTNSEESKTLIGRSTEVDAMVTFLEMMKTHPEITVVPGPLRYEANPRTRSHSGKKKNSDFIMFDTEKNEARGIQVKTRLARTDELEEYDSDYVSTIEGAADFGNTVFRGRKITNQAGLLSLGLIAEQPLSLQTPMSHRADYLRSRAIAREITRGVKPYLHNAVQHIGERVLRDLYK